MRVFEIEPEMQSHIDNIFGALLGGEDVEYKTKCRETLKSELSQNVFPDTYAILYSLVCQERIAHVDDVSSIIRASTGLLLDSEHIDRDRFSGGVKYTDYEFIEELVSRTSTQFLKYRESEVPESKFRNSLKIYKKWYMQEFYSDMLATAKKINTVGAWVYNKNRRRTHKVGTVEAQKYYAEQSLALEKVERGERTSSITIDENWLANVNDMFEMDGAFVTTGMDILDKHFVLRRGHFLGIAGPPKGGKTRMTAFLVARALLAGRNVCVWPLEGSVNEWISMIAASMLAQDTEISGNLASNISSSYILSGKFKRARAGYADRVNTILTQLATHQGADGKKIGTLSFIQQSCYAEDFLDVLEGQFETSPYDVIVIDQLVNILSRGGQYGSKAERISDSYMRMKDFIENKHKLLGLMPCQLKQEAIKRLRDKPDEDLDVTAGGESAETIRTPDYVLGIYATREEKMNSKCKFYCVATRHSQTFETFEAHADYGACYFCDDKSAAAIQPPASA